MMFWLEITFMIMLSVVAIRLLPAVVGAAVSVILFALLLVLALLVLLEEFFNYLWRVLWQKKKP